MVDKPVGIAVPDYTSFDVKGPYFGDLVFRYLEESHPGSFERIPIEVSRKGDSSSETFTRKNVRERDVYVLHPSVVDADTHTATARKMGDDLRRSDARRVTLFDLYNREFSYDKRRARQSLNARIVADGYADAHFDRVFTYDAHSDILALAFGDDCPLEILPLSRPLANYFRERYSTENVTVVSPDIGGYARAEIFADILDVPLIGLRKRRSQEAPDATEALEIVGDKKFVEGKKILFRDDIIRTGGSMESAVRLLREAGAEEFYAVVTHLELCGRAKDILRENRIKVIGTNTKHNRFSEEDREYIEEVDISRLTGRLIYLRSQGGSIKGFFDNFGPTSTDLNRLVTPLSQSQ